MSTVCHAWKGMGNTSPQQTQMLTASSWNNNDHMRMYIKFCFLSLVGQLPSQEGLCLQTDDCSI